jgi:hypothetical protein
MKFFTIDWWIGLQDFANDDPLPRFRKHLETIRERLPSGLLALQETVSLHDANLRLIDYSAQENSLILILDGVDGTGGLRQFTLRYYEVASFRTSADSERGLPGPYGYGDLGYDEPDITPDGKIEHRLLFSSGIELQMIFRNFELEWKDAT